MQKNRRVFVIDACIMRRANSNKYYPNNCTQFLSDLKKICHKIIYNQDILKEYRKHNSTYAGIWLDLMKNRKDLEKVKDNSNTDFIDLTEIEKEIFTIEEFHKEEIKEVKKDLRLIQAALSSDRLIVSNDVRLLRRLKRACNASDMIKSSIGDIRWIDPVKKDMVAIKKWLRAGAKKEEMPNILEVEL